MQVTYLGSAIFPKLQGPNNFRQETFFGCEGPFALDRMAGSFIGRGYKLSEKMVRFSLPANLDGNHECQVIGPWFDPTNGEWDHVRKFWLTKGLNQGYWPRGLHITDDRVMHMTHQAFYNNTGTANVHTHSRRDLITGEFRGIWRTQSSFRAGGPIGELPPKLQQHFGRDQMYIGTEQQGTSSVCAGPGLRVRSTAGDMSLASGVVSDAQDASGNPIGNPAGPILSDLVVIDYFKDTNPFPYAPGKTWDGCCRVDGLAGFPDGIGWFCTLPTQNAVVWYDKGVPAGSIWKQDGQMELNGVIYTDPFNLGTKGWHAGTADGSPARESVLLYLSNKNIMAGNIAPSYYARIPLNSIIGWTTSGLITSAINRIDGMLYILQAGAHHPAGAAAGSNQPRLHIFSFPTEAQMQEQIDAANAALAAALAANTAQATQLTAVQTALQNLQLAYDTQAGDFQAQLDAKNQELAAAIAGRNLAAAKYDILNNGIPDLLAQAAAL